MSDLFFFPNIFHRVNISPEQIRVTIFVDIFSLGFLFFKQKSLENYTRKTIPFRESQPNVLHTKIQKKTSADAKSLASVGNSRSRRTRRRVCKTRRQYLLVFTHRWSGPILKPGDANNFWCDASDRKTLPFHIMSYRYFQRVYLKITFTLYLVSRFFFSSKQIYNPCTKQCKK